MKKTILKNLVYGATPRHCGDLWLPTNEHAPLVLLIHGGGWGAMDRYAVDGIANFLQDQGFAVFNIEYRLYGEAKWPACGDDCLAALEFLRHGPCDGLNRTDRSRIAVLGGSAGGHLSLMTGLRAGGTDVKCTISISGITSVQRYKELNWPLCDKSLLGKVATPEEMDAASPLRLIRPDMPPVLLTHCRIDNVVSFEHAVMFQKRADAAGAKCELFSYLRPLDGHCIWIQGSKPHKLYPELEEVIADFLKKYLPVNC